MRQFHRAMVYGQPIARSILDELLPTWYIFDMVIKSIREFNATVPFVPYEIHMVSGERYSIPHPDFISISPLGSYVVVIDSKERPHPS